MKDLIAQYAELGHMPDISDLEDPFDDKPEPIFIGEGYYSLQGLAYLMDNPASLQIIGSNMQVCGKLEVEIVPVNQDGGEDLEFIPDEPADLID